MLLENFGDLRDLVAPGVWYGVWWLPGFGGARGLVAHGVWWRTGFGGSRGLVAHGV